MKTIKIEIISEGDGIRCIHILVGEDAEKGAENVAGVCVTTSLHGVPYYWKVVKWLDKSEVINE